MCQQRTGVQRTQAAHYYPDQSHSSYIRGTATDNDRKSPTSPAGRPAPRFVPKCESSAQRTNGTQPSPSGLPCTETAAQGETHWVHGTQCTHPLLTNNWSCVGPTKKQGRPSTRCGDTLPSAATTTIGYSLNVGMEVSLPAPRNTAVFPPLSLQPCGQLLLFIYIRSCRCTLGMAARHLHNTPIHHTTIHPHTLLYSVHPTAYSRIQ